MLDRSRRGDGGRLSYGRSDPDPPLEALNTRECAALRFVCDPARMACGRVPKFASHAARSVAVQRRLPAVPMEFLHRARFDNRPPGRLPHPSPRRTLATWDGPASA